LAGILCIAVPWIFRIPISLAWSTPGAALLVAAGGVTDDFGAAVGAFLVCGVLIVLAGLWPALGRLITGIPKPIAGAMLAGILFPICLAPVTASIEQPMLAIPVVVVWLVLYRLAPRWAVPAAMIRTPTAGSAGSPPRRQAPRTWSWASGPDTRRPSWLPRRRF
jgi:benzoate membrane transport protein